MGIIIKPIVTEKQTAITEKFPNRYGFRVSPDANKLEIKKAVEDMYSVTVVDVNTINYSGKRKAVIQIRYHQRQASCFQESDRNVERRRNN